MRKFAVIFAVLISAVLKAGVMDSYDFANDLRFNTIYSVTQDSRGYLWIGYDDGLARFDGHVVEPYRQQTDTLSLKNVNCLHFLSEDILLAGTNRGLFKYDIRFNNLEVYDNDLIKFDITDLVCSEDGMVVVASSNGVYVYKDNVLWRKLDESSGLTNNNVYSVFLDREKNLWIGTDSGISYVSLKKDSCECHKLSSQDRYSKVFADEYDNLWLCCNENILVGNRKSVECGQKLEKVAENTEAVTALCRRGEVLIGTRGGGLLRFNTGRGISPVLSERIYFDPINPSGLGNIVVSLCEDRFSNLWVATFDGLKQYSHKHDPAFVSIRHNPDDSNSPSHDVISSIWCSPYGEIWMGTAEGLNRMNWKAGEQAWEIERYKDERGSDNILGGNKIQSVEGLADGSLFISTKREIKFFNPDTRKFYKKKSVNDTLAVYGMKNVLCSSKDSKGNLYLGFAVGGLAVLTEEGCLKHIDIQGIGDARHRSLVIDLDDNLWVSSDNSGVYCVCMSENLQPLNRKEYPGHLFNDQHITAMYCDRDGVVWVGTMNGLYRYDSNTDSYKEFEHPYPRENFYVSGIIEDHSGNLWITGLRGIYRITDDAMVQYYEPLTRCEIGKTAYKSGLAIDKNGLIMLGGVSGLVCFNPLDVVPDTYVPTVHITGLSILNKNILTDGVHLTEDVDLASSVVLKHEDYQFTLSFSALYLTDPSKIKYAYKLEGFDQEWILPEPGRYQATYSNIRTGEYRFLVKSTNASGIWQDNVSSLLIHVRPAPWNTIWAWIMYIVIMILVIFMILKYLSLVQKVRYEQDMSQWKIQYYINLSHGFRGPLTLLQAPIKRLAEEYNSLSDEEKQHLLKMMETNVSKLNFRLSQLMAFRKVDIGKDELHLSTENIVSLIGTIYSNFSELAIAKGIDYRFNANMPEVEVVVDREKIELTLFNLLSNAFKYTERGGTVIISCELDASKQELWISVKDSGCGIPKEDLNKVFKRFWKGVGLSLANEYVNMHYGKLTVESEVGKGSEFCFSLRLGTSHFSKKEIAIIDSSEVKNRQLSESVITLASDFKSLMTPSDSSLPTLSIIGSGEELSAFLLKSFSARYNAKIHKYSEEICKTLSKSRPTAIIIDVDDDDKACLELCESIRKEPSLSTVPIIILSPFDTEAKVTSGFDAGADAYVIKPFTVSLLISRIDQLINTRERLKGHIKQELIVNPKEVDITSDNDIFLASIMKLMEEHMSDEDFNIDLLAAELNISRSMLYRKLQSITGQSPVKFIRTIRMKRAAQLLEATSYNVSEVSMMVGFSDQRYFSTCFRQQFGMSPKEWSLARRCKH